jgi:hypothetical protein
LQKLLQARCLSETPLEISSHAALRYKTIRLQTQHITSPQMQPANSCRNLYDLARRREKRKLETLWACNAHVSGSWSWSVYCYISNPTPEHSNNPHVRKTFASTGAVIPGLCDAEGTLLFKATLSRRAHWSVKLTRIMIP